MRQQELHNANEINNESCYFLVVLIHILSNADLFLYNSSVHDFLAPQIGISLVLVSL